MPRPNSPILVDAIGIHVNTLTEGYSPSPLFGERPYLAITIPNGMLEQFEATILHPYARPEHAIVGWYIHEDGRETLGAYLVIPTTDPSMDVVALGNEIDFDQSRWVALMSSAARANGAGIVVAGEIGLPYGSRVTTNPWHIVVTKFFNQNIKPIVSERIGLPYAGHF